MKLDDRDLAILDILTREGRISKAQLARRVNLSPSPCWERLRRLERAGLVRAYRAEVALEAFAPHLEVLVSIELGAHKAADFARFERAVAEMEDVAACWAVGGGFDYVLLVVAEDVERYQRRIDRLLAADIGVQRYFSYVVTKTIKPPRQPLPSRFASKETVLPKEPEREE